MSIPAGEDVFIRRIGQRIGGLYGGATVGVIGLCGISPLEACPQLADVVAGDVGGIVVFTPLILTWRERHRAPGTVSA
jgi:hypothetical protein